MKTALGLAAVWLVGLSLGAAAVSWAVSGGRGEDRVLSVWTFDAGAKYPETVDGVPIEVALAPLRISEVRAGARAQVARRSDAKSGASYLIETEIATAGKYLDGRADDGLFLPLDRLLGEAGLLNGILPERLSAWRNSGGHTRLLPRDVHPVTLTYREDLWTQAGVDLEAVVTWDDFISAAEKYEAFHTERDGKAIEWPRRNAAVLSLLLQQRSPAPVEQTLAWYGQAARRIGSDAQRNITQTALDLADGRLGAVITPDWRWGQIKRVAPQLAGKLRMRALPVFASSDAPTASWGGTGVGIPRDTPDVATSIKILAALYADRELAVARWREAGILPVTPEFWSDERIAAPDPFFGGQRVGELLARLAPLVRPIAITRDMPLRQAELNGLVTIAVNRPADLPSALASSSYHAPRGRP